MKGKRILKRILSVVMAVVFTVSGIAYTPKTASADATWYTLSTFASFVRGDTSAGTGTGIWQLNIAQNQWGSSEAKYCNADTTDGFTVQANYVQHGEYLLVDNLVNVLGLTVGEEYTYSFKIKANQDINNVVVQHYYGDKFNHTVNLTANTTTDVTGTITVPANLPVQIQIPAYAAANTFTVESITFTPTAPATEATTADPSAPTWYDVSTFASFVRGDTSAGTGTGIWQLNIAQNQWGSSEAKYCNADTTDGFTVQANYVQHGEYLLVDNLVNVLGLTAGDDYTYSIKIKADHDINGVIVQHYYGDKFNHTVNLTANTTTDVTGTITVPANLPVQIQIPAYADANTFTVESITFTKVTSEYTITYNNNGGSGTMTAGTVTSGDTFTLPECTFTAPEGKVFEHWAIGSADSEITKRPGETITPIDDTTIYAVWEVDLAPGEAIIPDGEWTTVGAWKLYNGFEGQLIYTGDGTPYTDLTLKVNREANEVSDYYKTDLQAKLENYDDLITGTTYNYSISFTSTEAGTAYIKLHGSDYIPVTVVAGDNTITGTDTVTNGGAADFEFFPTTIGLGSEIAFTNITFTPTIIALPGASWTEVNGWHLYNSYDGNMKYSTDGDTYTDVTMIVNRTVADSSDGYYKTDLQAGINLKTLLGLEAGKSYSYTITFTSSEDGSALYKMLGGTETVCNISEGTNTITGRVTWKDIEGYDFMFLPHLLPSGTEISFTNIAFTEAGVDLTDVQTNAATDTWTALYGANQTVAHTWNVANDTRYYIADSYKYDATNNGANNTFFTNHNYYGIYASGSLVPWNSDDDHPNNLGEVYVFNSEYIGNNRLESVWVDGVKLATNEYHNIGNDVVSVALSKLGVEEGETETIHYITARSTSGVDYTWPIKAVKVGAPDITDVKTAVAALEDDSDWTDTVLGDNPVPTNENANHTRHYYVASDYFYGGTSSNGFLRGTLYGYYASASDSEYTGADNEVAGGVLVLTSNKITKDFGGEGEGLQSVYLSDGTTTTKLTEGIDYYQNNETDGYPDTLTVAAANLFTLASGESEKVYYLTVLTLAENAYTLPIKVVRQSIGTPDYSDITVADDDWKKIGFSSGDNYADGYERIWFFSGSAYEELTGWTSAGMFGLFDDPTTTSYGGVNCTVTSPALQFNPGAIMDSNTGSIWVNDTKLIEGKNNVNDTESNTENIYHSTAAKRVYLINQELFADDSITYITVRDSNNEDHIIPIKVVVMGAPDVSDVVANATDQDAEWVTNYGTYYTDTVANTYNTDQTVRYYIESSYKYGGDNNTVFLSNFLYSFHEAPSGSAVEGEVYQFVNKISTNQAYSNKFHSLWIDGEKIPSEDFNYTNDIMTISAKYLGVNTGEDETIHYLTIRDIDGVDHSWPIKAVRITDPDLTEARANATSSDAQWEALYGTQTSITAANTLNADRTARYYIESSYKAGGVNNNAFTTNYVYGIFPTGEDVPFGGYENNPFEGEVYAIGTKHRASTTMSIWIDGVKLDSDDYYYYNDVLSFDLANLGLADGETETIHYITIRNWDGTDNTWPIKVVSTDTTPDISGAQAIVTAQGYNGWTDRTLENGVLRNYHNENSSHTAHFWAATEYYYKGSVAPAKQFLNGNWFGYFDDVSKFPYSGDGNPLETDILGFSSDIIHRGSDSVVESVWLCDNNTSTKLTAGTDYFHNTYNYDCMTINSELLALDENEAEHIYYLVVRQLDGTEYMLPIRVADIPAPDLTNVTINSWKQFNVSTSLLEDDGYKSDGYKWFYSPVHYNALCGNGTKYIETRDSKDELWFNSSGGTGNTLTDADIKDNTIEGPVLAVALNSSYGITTVWVNDQKMTIGKDFYTNSGTDSIYFSQKLFTVTDQVASKRTDDGAIVTYITVRYDDGRELILPIKVYTEDIPPQTPQPDDWQLFVPNGLVEHGARATDSTGTFVYYINTDAVGERVESGVANAGPIVENNAWLMGCYLNDGDDNAQGMEDAANWYADKNIPTLSFVTGKANMALCNQTKYIYIRDGETVTRYDCESLDSNGNPYVYFHNDTVHIQQSLFTVAPDEAEHEYTITLRVDDDDYQFRIKLARRPNMVIQSITLPNDKPYYVGDTIPITVITKNNSLVDAVMQESVPTAEGASLTTSLWVNDAWKWYTILAATAPWAQAEFECNDTFVAGGTHRWVYEYVVTVDDVGNAAIRAKADNDEKLVETYEDDNELTVYHRFFPAIRELTFTNTGSSIKAEWPETYRKDEDKPDSAKLVVQLADGTEKEITVDVDDTEYTFASDEILANNSEAILYLTKDGITYKHVVGTPMADLVVTDIKSKSGVFLPGVRATLVATVKNIGTAATSNADGDAEVITVNVRGEGYNGGAGAWAVMAATKLAPNTPCDVDINQAWWEGGHQIYYTPDAESSNELTAVVDEPFEGAPNGRIPESNEENNTNVITIVTGDSGIQVIGFQMNTDMSEGGVSEFMPSFRVVSRATHKIVKDGEALDVKKFGTIYALTDSAQVISEDSMVLDSENDFIMNMEATTYSMSWGGKEEEAYYFPLTIKQLNYKYDELKTKYSFRAYAILEDDTVVYSSNICTVDTYEIAENLYKEQKMHTLASHNFLYDQVLNIVAMHDNAQSIGTAMLRALNVSKTSDPNYTLVNKAYKDLIYYSNCTFGYKYQTRETFRSLTLGAEDEATLLNNLNTATGTSYTSLFKWIQNETQNQKNNSNVPYKGFYTVMPYDWDNYIYKDFDTDPEDPTSE